MNKISATKVKSVLIFIMLMAALVLPFAAGLTLMSDTQSNLHAVLSFK